VLCDVCDAQQIWTCQLCKKKQELLVKTGQWYHGSMAKPITLDIDVGSDASSIKTDSSSISDKRPSISQPDQHQMHQHNQQLQQMGGATVPTGSSPRMRQDSLGRSEGNGAPAGGIGYGDMSSRYPRPPAGPGGPPRTSGLDGPSDYGVGPVMGNMGPSGQQAVDMAGRMMVDESGRPLAKLFNDNSGRPYVDHNGRQMVDQNSRTMNEPGINGRQPMSHPGDPNSRPLIDPVTRLPVDAADHSARSRQSTSSLDGNGRPADPAGRPLVASELGSVRLAGDREPLTRSSLDNTDISARTVDSANRRPVPDVDGKLPIDPSSMQHWRPDGSESTPRHLVERPIDDVTQRRPSRENENRRPPPDSTWQSRDTDPAAKGAVRPSPRPGQQWPPLEDR